MMSWFQVWGSATRIWRHLVISRAREKHSISSIVNIKRNIKILCSLCILRKDNWRLRNNSHYHNIHSQQSINIAFFFWASVSAVFFITFLLSHCPTSQFKQMTSWSVIIVYSLSEVPEIQNDNELNQGLSDSFQNTFRNLHTLSG